MILDRGEMRRIDKLIGTVRDPYCRDVLREILKVVSRVEEKCDGNWYILRTGGIPHEVSDAFEDGRNGLS